MKDESLPGLTDAQWEELLQQIEDSSKPEPPSFALERFYPPHRSLAERIDSWLQRHPMTQAILGGVLFMALVLACAWLLLSVPEVGW